MTALHITPARFSRQFSCMVGRAGFYAPRKMCLDVPGLVPASEVFFASIQLALWMHTHTHTCHAHGFSACCCCVCFPWLRSCWQSLRSSDRSFNSFCQALTWELCEQQVPSHTFRLSGCWYPLNVVLVGFACRCCLLLGARRFVLALCGLHRCCLLLTPYGGPRKQSRALQDFAAELLDDKAEASNS